MATLLFGYDVTDRPGPLNIGEFNPAAIEFGAHLEVVIKHFVHSPCDALEMPTLPLAGKQLAHMT